MGVVIDGSFGEGGGQIIRNAVTLACLTRSDINVVNIRANRPNPGLASQHLESIKAMMRISGATTAKEPAKQDTSFDLHTSHLSSPGPLSPSPPSGVNTTIDLVTAGSCTLCIQCILPYLLALSSPSRVRVIGGTHVLKSPSFDYFQRVFLRNFNQCFEQEALQTSPAIESWLRSPGYFPRGGGCIDLNVNPSSAGPKFPSIQLTDRGTLQKVEAILNVTPRMKPCIGELKNLMAHRTRNIEVRIVSFASVEFFFDFEKSSAGFSHLVEGRNPNFDQLAKGLRLVEEQIEQFLQSSAAVDGWMQDQLIVYMTLAKLAGRKGEQESVIRTTPLSDHCTSAIHVCQLIVPEHKFKISQNQDDSVEVSL